MGAVSAFTTGNYHCKPLMTDVIVIHQVNLEVRLKIYKNRDVHLAQIADFGTSVFKDSFLLGSENRTV